MFGWFAEYHCRAELKKENVMKTRFCSEKKHEMETTFETEDGGTIIPVLIKGVIVDEGEGMEYVDDLEVILLSAEGRQLRPFVPQSEYERQQVRNAETTLMMHFKND